MDILPDDAPAPRLCHLIKWPDFDGYGFNLHAERSNPGQFIGKIDDDSPAKMAGLREGDKIIEVNGVNISNENHRQVVERIKADPQETKLLVVDPETDLWYGEQDIVIKSSQMNVVYVKTPIPRPLPGSPRAKFHQQIPPASVSGGTTSETGSAIAHSSDEQAQLTQQASLSPSTHGGSSLETSDFNEDSIEQQQIVKQQQYHQQQLETVSKSETNESSQIKGQKSGSVGKPSPPMSPDSGKGDEEPANVVTIEAEINRQSPQRQQLIMRDNQEEEFESRGQVNNIVNNNNNNIEQQEQDDTSKSISNSIEPDSLSSQSTQKLPPNSCQVSRSNQLNSDMIFLMNLFHSATIGKRCCAVAWKIKERVF